MPTMTHLVLVVYIVWWGKDPTYVGKNNSCTQDTGIARRDVANAVADDPTHS